MSFFASLFAPGEQARSDELDRRHRELNQRNVERGLTTPEDLARYDRAIANQQSVEDQLSDAFDEGAAEGLADMQGGVQRAINGTVSGALGFLPTWVKVAAVIAAVVWVANNLGGLNWVRKKLS